MNLNYKTINCVHILYINISFTFKKIARITQSGGKIYTLIIFFMEQIYKIKKYYIYHVKIYYKYKRYFIYNIIYINNNIFTSFKSFTFRVFFLSKNSKFIIEYPMN